MARNADITVEPLAERRVFVGCHVLTSDDRLFEDAPRLARAFAGIKEDVPDRLMPVLTASILCEPDDAGGRLSFSGDEVRASAKRWPEAGVVSEGEPCSLEVPAGTLVARVPVRYVSQATLPLRIAQVRKWFWDEWLPNSGYAPASGLRFRDLELYHYRRRRFRRARKLEVELMFCLERV